MRSGGAEAPAPPKNAPRGTHATTARRETILTPAAGRSDAPRGTARPCELTGKDEWSFVADVVFMEKEAVPKNLNRPGTHGRSLLRQDRGHFQIHHVYKTKDAKGDTVYWAHKDSL